MGRVPRVPRQVSPVQLCQHHAHRHQRRGATLVAGYRKWQELGRQVRKGERGIAIFAPIVRKVETHDGDAETVVRFRILHVFDVAQTDGEPLPEPCKMLEAGGDQADYMRILDHAHAQGLTVDVDDIAGGANGYIRRDGQRIVIGAHCFETGTQAQRIKTLAHELGHWHDLGPDESGRYERDAAEIVAESVAYVVGHALGLDTSDYSAGYVLTWADGDVDKRRDLAERIDKAARPILDTIVTVGADGENRA
jgi:antirestriction protein ArdC